MLGAPEIWRPFERFVKRCKRNSKITITADLSDIIFVEK
jgi:hypothetical protein